MDKLQVKLMLQANSGRDVFDFESYLSSQGFECRFNVFSNLDNAKVEEFLTLRNQFNLTFRPVDSDLRCVMDGNITDCHQKLCNYFQLNQSTQVISENSKTWSGHFWRRIVNYPKWTTVALIATVVIILFVGTRPATLSAVSRHFSNQSLAANDNFFATAIAAKYSALSFKIQLLFILLIAIFDLIGLFVLINICNSIMKTSQKRETHLVGKKSHSKQPRTGVTKSVFRPISNQLSISFNRRIVRKKSKTKWFNNSH